MSRQELEFLRLVNSTRSNLKALTTPELLSHFIRAERLGHIAKNPTTGAYELTEKGIQRMVFSEDQLEQQEQQQAAQREQYQTQRADADQDRKKQFRHDWRIAFVEIFASFVLGAIADHFFDIVVKCAELWFFLASLFH